MKRVLRFRCALAVALPLALCVACTSRPVADTPPTTTTFGATAVLSATAIDFGDAPCGGASPQDFDLTLSNTGNVSLGYTAIIASPGFALPSSGSGLVYPGESTTLTVHVVTPPSSRSSAAMSGDLMLTTDDVQQATIDVPLSITPPPTRCSL